MLSKIKRFIKSVIIDADTGEQAGVSRGSLKVAPDYPLFDSLDLYLYRLDATLVLTATQAIDDIILNVVSSIGAVVGDVITIYEDDRVYQSLITATTATTVTLSSPLDYAFTTSAIVDCGKWLMNVDGSITEQEFIIKAPQNSGIEIHSFRSSMLDSSTMDDGLFGGIPALTNGVIMRYSNSTTRNLALLINNLGFFEEGYTKTYSDKAPSGQYGVVFDRNIPGTNGVIVLLEGGNNAILKVVVRDDLTALDQFTFTIHGHLEG